MSHFISDSLNDCWLIIPPPTGGAFIHIRLVEIEKRYLVPDPDEIGHCTPIIVLPGPIFPYPFEGEAS